MHFMGSLLEGSMLSSPQNRVGIGLDVDQEFCDNPTLGYLQGRKGGRRTAGEEKKSVTAIYNCAHPVIIMVNYS